MTFGAAAQIKAEGKTLCYNSVQQVYAESDVLFARHRSDLLIRVAFPYTSRPKYTAYQSLIFDLPVTGRQGFKTRIDHFPQYFVMHMASGKLGTIEQKPTSNYIQSGDVKWILPYTQNCLADIMMDDRQLIQTSCQFSVIQNTIPQTYHRIAPNKYILTNYSQVYVRCSDSEGKTLNQADCSLCLLTLECNCQLYQEHRVILTEFEGCVDNSTAESQIHHAINLPLLDKFYNLADETINGAQLISPQHFKEPVPIQWRLFAERTNQTLAASKKLSFSLNRLAEAYNNDSVVYAHSAEAILDEYMHELMTATVTGKQNTDWQDYLQWSAAALTIPIMALIVRQQIKIKQLAQMITIITALPKGHAFELLRPELRTATTMATTSEMTTMNVISLLVQQMMNNITVIDTLMFSLLP
jgi:hypothetical protein